MEDGLFWTNDHDYGPTPVEEDPDPLSEEWEAREFEWECGDR